MIGQKHLAAFLISTFLAVSSPGWASEALQTEMVTFSSNEPGITLSGALSLPETEGQRRIPAVVLISGAGPQNRDSTIAGVPIFKMLAESLTSKGLAVLRYDDRGVGESTTTAGLSFGDQTVHDFAKDAQGALDYLRKRPDIDQQRIFLVGHSEGGLVAAIAAADKRDLAGVVFMAATAIPLEQIQLEQRRASLKDDGLPDQEIEKKLDLSRQVFQVLRSTRDLREAEEKIADIMRSHDLPVQRANKYAKLMSSIGFSTLAGINPSDFFGRIRVPVLAVNGSGDFQVLAESNLAAISASLKSAGVKDVKIVKMQGLNHLFQEARSVASSSTKPPMAPAFLQLIGDWLIEH